MPKPKPFNQGRKAAGERVVKAAAKKAAAERAAIRAMASEAAQLAIPFPGGKIKTAVKAGGAVVRAIRPAAKAAVKKVPKPRKVVLLANRGSNETMAKVAKNEAIKANMRKNASAPEARSTFANAARAMLNEPNAKKRASIIKTAERQVKKINQKKGK